MAYCVTPTEVVAGFDTTAATATVQVAIEVADEADACLATHAVPQAIGQTLKIALARHILTLSTGGDRGRPVSEASASGANRSYAPMDAGRTSHLELIEALDKWGCVRSLVAGAKPYVRIAAVG
jgi:hypothetical protein